MDIAVLVLVEVGQAFDHLARLLGGGGIVEPDQAATIDALVEDGEIPAHAVEIDRRGAVAGLRDGGRPGILDGGDGMAVRGLVVQEVVRCVCSRRHRAGGRCRGGMEMAGRGGHRGRLPRDAGQRCAVRVEQFAQLGLAGDARRGDGRRGRPMARNGLGPPAVLIMVGDAFGGSAHRRALDRDRRSWGRSRRDCGSRGLPTEDVVGQPGQGCEVGQPLPGRITYTRACSHSTSQSRHSRARRWRHRSGPPGSSRARPGRRRWRDGRCP